MDPGTVFGAASPLVGMVHLPPLPGAPRYGGSRAAIRGRVRSDATALAAGGVDAVIVENFGDAPFYPDQVPPHVVASITDLVRTVRDTVDVPVGVNVLRNDAAAAIAIAAATGAAFVRVNVHVGARVADQGLLEGRAHETMRLRERLDADIAVLADLAVKHSAPIGSTETEGLADVVRRGLADGVIVSGRATGDEPTVASVEEVVGRRDELGLDVPVVVGSGVTPETVASYLALADGVIVGSALKDDGVPTNPVDADRVAALVAAVRR